MFFVEGLGRGAAVGDQVGNAGEAGCAGYLSQSLGGGLYRSRFMPWRPAEHGHEQFSAPGDQRGLDSDDHFRAAWGHQASLPGSGPASRQAACSGVLTGQKPVPGDPARRCVNAGVPLM
jgi:hypothetical protein